MVSPYVLACISLMTHAVEHIFMYLFTICISSLPFLMFSSMRISLIPLILCVDGFQYLLWTLTFLPSVSVSHLLTRHWHPDYIPESVYSNWISSVLSIYVFLLYISYFFLLYHYSFYPTKLKLSIVSGCQRNALKERSFVVIALGKHLFSFLIFPLLISILIWLC